MTRSLVPLLVCCALSFPVLADEITTDDLQRAMDVLMSNGLRKRHPSMGSPNPGPGYMGPYHDLYTVRLSGDDADYEIILRRLAIDDWCRRTMVRPPSRTATADPGQPPKDDRHTIEVNERRRGKVSTVVDEGVNGVIDGGTLVRDRRTHRFPSEADTFAAVYAEAIRVLLAEEKVDERRIASIRDYEEKRMAYFTRQREKNNKFKGLKVLDDLKALPLPLAGPYGSRR